MTRIFPALGRFAALVGAIAALVWLYDLEDAASAWLREHRELTTIIFALYIALDILYFSMIADGARTRARGEELMQEADNDELDG